MGDCCKATTFLVTCFVLIGAVLASLIYLLAAYHTFLNTDSLKKYKTWLIISAIVVGCLLIICVFFSICNNKCTRNMVSIILVIFDLAIFVIAIIVFIFGKNVPQILHDNWYKNNFGELIQNFSHCCNYSELDNYSDKCDEKYRDTNCEKYGQAIEKNFKTIGGILIGVFVLFIIIIALLFWIACRSGDNDDSAIPTKDQFNTPLTYGW